MTAYYNEHDENAAAWLRELIKEGQIADGVVDTGSIVAVEAADLRDFTQCHFFAGIGGWSLALRLAGWPDDRPVWTGSCPCQPFSAAGKREGFNDERHLWPHFHRLIAECRPAIVLGEQVASKDGLNWLDTVFADLEGSGYAAGAADMCAAGLGAPHIRQRLWFVGKRVGVAGGEGLEGQRGGHPAEGGRLGAVRPAAAAGEPRGLADTELHGRTPGKISGGVGAGEENRGMQQSEGRCTDGRMADADGWDAGAERQQRGGEQRQQPEDGGAGDGGRPGPVNGHWRDADWLYCRDGKWRPVEPGTFPLAHGLPARVGRLRGYGNAIVPSVAAAFIEAVME